MPKEQPYSSDHGLCATSSKNAKNKSNCMTLLAMRDTKDTDNSSGRGSRCSSEKDSGFSDGSDWQQTDVEDRQSNKSRSRSSEHAETSQPGQTKESGQEIPAGHKHPPIYIINNIVLKQPDVIQKNSQPAQSRGSKEASGPSAAHVILFQPPSTQPATLQFHKPLARKSNITGKKTNGTYLPILNSYPRIAPLPSKKLPDKPSWDEESLNLSKRVCTEHKSGDTLMSRSLPEQHLHKQPKLAALTPGLPCSSLTTDASSSTPAAVSSVQGSPPGSSLCTTSTKGPPTKGHLRNGGIRTRHHRFLNTLEILRQSGLLDITLRTRELLRQSNAAERNIAQLRQHTELLCQAASDPSGHITAWEQLHRAMAESGSYPDLKILQDLQILCHPDSVSQPVSISIDESTGPLSADNSERPSSLSIPNSNSEQGMELKAGDKSSEKVTSMPPDSSTG